MATPGASPSPADSPAAPPARGPGWFSRGLFALGLASFGVVAASGLVFSWTREKSPLPPLHNDPTRDAVREHAGHDGQATAKKYRIAAMLSRNDPALFRRAGQAAQMIGDAPGARQAYLRALALDPSDAESYYGLGLLALERGDAHEAVSRNLAVIKLQPHHAQAFCNLGSALVALGKPSEAIDCYRRALQIDPGLQPARAALRELTGFEPP